MKDDGEKQLFQPKNSLQNWPGVGAAAKDVSSSQMIVFQLVRQAQKNKWEKQSSQGLGPQCILGKGDAIQPVSICIG